MPETIYFQVPAKPVQIGFAFWLQWILVTLFGFLLSLLVIEIGESPHLGIREGVIGGAIIGLTQFLVLRGHIRQAWWWIVASIICWGLLGFSSLSPLGWVVPRTTLFSARIFYGALFGALIGIGLGVPQWLVLRPRIPKAWRWILMSSLCWAISLAFGWTVGGVLRLLSQLFLGDVVGLTLAWLAVGILQGIALVRLLQDATYTKFYQ